jgi:ribonuclease R
VLNDLAHRLRKERFRKGSIAFETQEVKFELDEDGKPLKVIPKVRNDAHKLVEDFMLLANKKVAEFIYTTKDGKNPKTFVYRIHEEPNPEKLDSFARFASLFGHSVNIETGRLSHELNRLTAELEGKPEENVVQSLAIRAMSKARYTIETLGHFGLGFKHYTHFTSPIRRYPDVMVHRLLALYLDKAKSADEDTYEDMCSHCSAREKVAADAERASIKYKQVEFMQNMAQQEWEGIVSGITDWGIFVEIIETKCEGMVRLADLTDDFYDFDAENLRVVGRNSKRMITFGDPLRVKIKKTDLRTRTIDLSIVRNESDSERPIEKSSRKRRR